MSVDTERTVRALEAERNIMLDRLREIGNAISLLQSLKLAAEEDKIRRKPMAKRYRMENMRGVVLGNIPVKAIGKSHVAKPKKKNARPYVKRSEFWNKPHPRKKK